MSGFVIEKGIVIDDEYCVLNELRKLTWKSIIYKHITGSGLYISGGKFNDYRKMEELTMGLFDDDSIIGFDYNCDGRVDMLDDIMFNEDMDEDERREASEDAGLDPDDYDF